MISVNCLVQLLCLATTSARLCTGPQFRPNISLVPGDSTHWASPYTGGLVEQCQELDRKLLENLQTGMLGDMCDDGEQCGKIIVTSMGHSAVKQPTR